MNKFNVSCEFSGIEFLIIIVYILLKYESERLETAENIEIVITRCDGGTFLVTHRNQRATTT